MGVFEFLRGFLVAVDCSKPHYLQYDRRGVSADESHLLIPRIVARATTFAVFAMIVCSRNWADESEESGDLFLMDAPMSLIGCSLVLAALCRV